MKILTKEWAKGALTAIEQTIEKYRDMSFFGTSSQPAGCPLCEWARVQNRWPAQNNYCQICPWVVFKGVDCVNLKYMDDLIPLRLERLYEWKRKCEEILEEVDNA